MSDVFDVLKTDHEEVEGMLAELESGGGRSAGEVAEKLVIEESRHEAVEEMHFWPAVRDHLDDGETLAGAALQQESEGKEVLESLRKAEPGSAEFTSLIAKFAKAGREHIAFEENRVWPELQAVLSAEQRTALGEKISSAKKSAPTRPHPHGPDSATGLKTVGTVAAATDKARDAASRRGQ